MAEAGILGPDERTELLRGDVYTMAAMGSRHANRVRFCTRWFGVRLGNRAIVSVQCPILLPSSSEPEPDLVLLRPPEDRYEHAQPGPGDLLLLIEIADTPLAHDRSRKMPLYAEAGIAEAWLVDLTMNRVLIHRHPSPTGYRSVPTIERNGVLVPTAFPDLRLPVADLLPSWSGRTSTMPPGGDDDGRTRKTASSRI